MKRSWLSILIIGGVLGLLTLFVGLQYKWLSKASEAERERMQKRIETDVNRFAEDFNREMQAAYYNFQLDSDTWAKGDWNEFNKRFDFWKGRTSYPELIRAMYFVNKEAGSAPLKYEPERQAFVTSETTPELESLRAKFSDEKTFVPFYEQAATMVLPIYHGEKHVERIMFKEAEKGAREIAPSVRMPEKAGWLVIQLDDPTIKNRLIPDLVAKYFPDGDYKLAIVNKNESPIFSTAEMTSEADATVPLFNLSPDNLLFFASDALPKMLEEHRQGVVIDQRVESHTFTARTDAVNGKTGSFQVELKPAPNMKPRRSVMTATTESGSEPWVLRAQHVSGSVDSFVNAERNKSFMIGLGIYLLLVGGILAIVLSALRSRAFAQRQIDFVSSVSHEFRTPLAVIYSAGENLADGVAKENDQVSRYGELIKGEGKKLSGMVEQILEFAGANSGRRKYSFTAIDAADVVREAIDESRGLIDAGEFTVETDLQSNLPMISADRTALSSAIQNLISNSVKYSNGSKWLRVSAVNGGGSVKISIEDKGLGIPSDEVRRIFDPFYRAKEVVDAQISGNGLGLNLVKKIVEAHGGKISVESQPGQGSKFTIELPQD